MLKNYFTIALRSLQRNKSYAAINIIGLAVGIAACLLLFMVIRFEKSFDTFHTKKANTYRVVSAFKGPERTNYSAGVPFPVAKALRIDYPQLKRVAAIYQDNDVPVLIQGSNGEVLKKFKEARGVVFAEPQFFQLFDFKLLAGNLKTAVTEPNTAMLSRATAERYFDNWQTAIGKTIRIGSKTFVKITGILEDIPVNSDFPLKVVISYATLASTGVKSNLEDWVSTYGNAYCFVELPENYSPAQFDASLGTFVKKHKPAEYVKDGLTIQPLGEMHFDSRFGNFNGRTFSRELITALGLIGLFLLIIACVNFINLATAQAVNRSKEVGVRKVLGSSRRQLVMQFLGETSIITFFAMLLALVFVVLALPLLNNLLRVQLSFNPFSEPFILAFLAVAFVLVTLLSGFYPALVLSGFNPINALKRKTVSTGKGNISLRRALVVLQFVIAQVLIIGTLVVVKQMSYFTNANMGFKQDAIINVPFPSDSLSRSHIAMLRNELKQDPGVRAVSFSLASPADNTGWNSDFKYDNSSVTTDFNASLKWADTGYFRMYNLQFVAGRMYLPSDTIKEYVVNEMLLEKLGVHDPADAINKKLNLWNGEKVGLIVGVIKDFHASSLRNPIIPVLMSTWNDVYQVANIQVQQDKAKPTLATIEKLWNKYFPNSVFEYTFLDHKIADFYRQESQLARLYEIFASIAIFISCLGLYGLISFMAVQRNKEMGIRKVLGASVANVVYLLSKEFTLLIIFAFLVSSPIAYYFMHKWLEQYAFKVPLGADIFLITIFASIIIAWLTVGYRAFRTALVNPVKSLRTE
ncbi:MAG: FtsX-like permease family protein [Sediminibacterium sp.]|nr:FtsX-like permease family protein [Sediminibacterium sp.]